MHASCGTVLPLLCPSSAAVPGVAWLGSCSAGFSVKLKSIRPLVIMQAAEAELLKNKGVIINVSSVSAVSESPVPGLTPYYVAKAAQVGVQEACPGHKRSMLQQQPGRLLAVALHC